KTRFLLYTVPGQVYYNATRKLVLKGVDAVVFVADSKRGKMDENVESLQNLRENLLEHGLKLEEVPFVLQYNKRDLPEVYSISELDQVLNPMGVPAYEAVATSGPGVVETFKAVSKLLLKKLAGEIGVPIVGSGKADGIELGTPPATEHTPIVSSEPQAQKPASGGGAWAQQPASPARGAWAQQQPAHSVEGAQPVQRAHPTQHSPAQHGGPQGAPAPLPHSQQPFQQQQSQHQLPQQNQSQYQQAQQPQFEQQPHQQPQFEQQPHQRQPFQQHPTPQQPPSQQADPQSLQAGGGVSDLQIERHSLETPPRSTSATTRQGGFTSSLGGPVQGAGEGAASSRQQGAPNQQHGASSQQQGAPNQQHGASSQQHGAPTQPHDALAYPHGAPSQQYEAGTHQHGAPTQQQAVPSQQYSAGATEQHGVAPSHQHGAGTHGSAGGYGPGSTAPHQGTAGRGSSDWATGADEAAASSAHDGSHEEGADSRSSGGVAARLRRWLKRDDSAEHTNEEPSSGAETWETRPERTAGSHSADHPATATRPAHPDHSTQPEHAVSLEHTSHPESWAQSGSPAFSAGASHEAPATGPSAGTSELRPGAPTPVSASGSILDEPRREVPADVLRQALTAQPSATGNPVSAQTETGEPRGALSFEDEPRHGSVPDPDSRSAYRSDRSSERMSDRRSEQEGGTREPRPRAAAREIVVPLELSARDLEKGIVLRLSVRLSEDLEDPERIRRAA
ncbi:MAG: hypothetical protein KC729_18395, partial [Candidatus Eisenbacteria bacterium]|nr:hypothetical protein [Candidatus Eisenbacteria bacterium]